jgi:ABC-type nitrate/sulfonate/bicarbonate transport system ATPase subunit
MPNDLAYVFQEERLIAELTVYQNIRLVLLKHFPKALNEMNVLINKYLTLVNLYQVKDLYPHELSGSMRQRLSLARAFVCSSKVLVMDEPFGGIDVMMKKALISDIIKLWNIDHPTVIFVTHDLDEAILMSDVIHVMGNLPIHLIRTLKVNGSKTNRKINSRQLTLIKNQIYHLIKN